MRQLLEFFKSEICRVSESIVFEGPFVQVRVRFEKGGPEVHC